MTATRTLQIQVRAINGAGPSHGIAEIVNRSLGERLLGSSALLGIGLLVGLLFLPIPLLHLFGFGLFIASGILALKRFRVRALVRRVVGQCPSCGQETGFFVGGGQLAARWPLACQCSACGIAVQLTPAGASEAGSGVVD